ncbi:PRTRC system protein C [Paraburkholderia sp. BL10I2N1]|uniref:PRTRC system protein C n=1 Tax=Paraburkholderia sp. BL10I2N1 TaxID=1938796 RepID=UPI00105FA718|nr:PRTRC system protein C [Paraburkholderia sp. BL10I2N1]TDN59055.1 PRTRC genetic system protein C [Paraburkholderia sp. BL10I2N1]
MSISISKLVREFAYNEVKFVDPGPTFSPDEVRDLYSAQYPELTTAAIEGPVYDGETARYTFRRAAGAKGSDA